MTERPVVLTTTRREMRKGKPVQFVAEAHLRVVLDAGGLPVVVPAVDGVGEGDVERLLDLADAVLMTEGGDLGVDHQTAPPERSDLLHDLEPDKDTVDMAVVRGALERELPYLGVCRGAQLANVALGGTLFADVNVDGGSGVVHVDERSNDLRDAHRHAVHLLDGQPLAALFDTDRIDVTSVHHQAVADLAPGLEPMARSEDGLVEAFRAPGRPFLWAVQFHPERQLGEHPGHRRVFEALLDAARHRT